MSSVPSTPQNNRPRVSHLYSSPASTPSISSSIPFDWQAARSRRPPPYATPRRKTESASTPATPLRPRKSIIRKKSFYEKITSIPSQIAFQVALFPNNVPLPHPTTSAKIIGGSLHFLHLCVRVVKTSQVPDSDLAWEDMYHEDSGASWFDWTVPVTTFLLIVAFLNTIYLFSRTKIYRLHRKLDPVSSPNSKFVPTSFDRAVEEPSLLSHFLGLAWHAFKLFWRFLLGLKPSTQFGPAKKARTVQQLEVWTPGDLELMLFCIYSPAHAILWMATASNNWMLMLFLMIVSSTQLNIVTSTFKTLLKDKEIIAAEVMSEYNEGFVYPKINPIRKDVAVMTHQSEVVNIWED